VGARLTGFPPIVDDSATVLVLGSMPSAESLRVGQYYAHPRNLFWPIIGELLGFDATADYALRTDALRRAGIGVWDVLHECEREGSLDSSIARETMVVNDFEALFAACPRLNTVFFNGAKAEEVYRRRVGLPRDGISYLRLPSTSPANAAMPYEAKLAAWQAIVDYAQPSG
jgi:hypoxanthine-DNA glycosylase